MEDYTQEELDAFQEDYLLNSGEKIVYEDHATFKKVSLADLRFSNNAEAFSTLKSWIEEKSFITLDFGIENGCPYYRLNTTPIKQKLYHNKEILNYLYDYFENGVLNTVIPNNYIGAQNAKENYVLHLLKRDRQNGKMFYDNEQVKTLAGMAIEIDTDDSTSYVDLKNFVPRHNAQIIPKEKVGEVLPWIHIAISNAKRQIINTFHGVKPEFLQKYLDEFCYKFNRRYFGEALFNRLLVACVSYKNEFRYAYG